MGLLQCAIGLSRTKVESPKDSYNATLRENTGGASGRGVRVDVNREVKFLSKFKKKI